MLLLASKAKIFYDLDSDMLAFLNFDLVMSNRNSHKYSQLIISTQMRSWRRNPRKLSEGYGLIKSPLTVEVAEA